MSPATLKVSPGRSGKKGALQSLEEASRRRETFLSGGGSWLVHSRSGGRGGIEHPIIEELAKVAHLSPRQFTCVFGGSIMDNAQEGFSG
ncbi:hypothetical protein D3C75_917500 [compost metagenome]